MVDRGATLEIEVQDDPTQYRVTLRGELDIDGAGRVSEALARAEQGAASWIVVDLSERQYRLHRDPVAAARSIEARSRTDTVLSFTRGGPQVERVLKALRP